MNEAKPQLEQRVPFHQLPPGSFGGTESGQVATSETPEHAVVVGYANVGFHPETGDARGTTPFDSLNQSQNSDDTAVPEISRPADTRINDGDAQIFPWDQSAPETADDDLEDVTSFDAYRERVQSYSDAYGLNMTPRQIDKEARRQRRRDFKPGVVTRLKNRAYKLQGGFNDQRIERWREQPVWYKDYLKAVGRPAMQVVRVPEAVGEAEPVGNLEDPEDALLVSLDELLDGREEVQEAQAVDTSATETIKQRIGENYLAWRRGEWNRERADRRQQRINAVRARIAGLALALFLYTQDPKRELVGNETSRKAA